MLRLASSALIPNALRAIASPRILSGSATSAFKGSNPFERESPNCIISQNFSTDGKKQIDDKLAKILKSEIKSKQLTLGKKMPAAPAHFPFAIEYSPCRRTATLTRELNGEKIEVVVSLPRNMPEADGEESDSSGTDTSEDDSDNNGDGGVDHDSSSTDSNSDEEKENACDDEPVPHVHLSVKISKENGKVLNFWASACAEKVVVSTMSAVEPPSQSNDRPLRFGPYFVGCDSDLQFPLREYLEMRGIKKSIGGFLYKYMVRQSKRDPINSLKKLKKFIKD